MLILESASHAKPYGTHYQLCIWQLRVSLEATPKTVTKAGN